MALNQAIVFHQAVVSCALAALTAIGGFSLGRERLLISLQMSEAHGGYDATTNSLVVVRSTINGYSNANRPLGRAILAMGNRCPEERFKPAATPPDPMNFSVAVAADPVLMGQNLRLSSLEEK
jgi:hypothetical protein